MLLHFRKEYFHVIKAKGDTSEFIITMAANEDCSVTDWNRVDITGDSIVDSNDASEILPLYAQMSAGSGEISE